MGRKRKERCLQKRSGRAAPAVKTLTSSQPASCFSSWVLGTPTMWPFILIFSTLLSCLQPHTLSSCCRSLPLLCTLAAGAGLLDVSVDLYSHASSQITHFSHALWLTRCSLPTHSIPCSALFPQMLCTANIVHLLPCCLFIASAFAVCYKWSPWREAGLDGVSCDSWVSEWTEVLGASDHIYSCDFLRFPGTW